MATSVANRTGPANAANGTSTILTVTSGHTYTVPENGLVIVNNTSGSITYKVGIGGVTDAVLIQPAIPVAPGAAFTHPSRIVLLTTETLQVNASATGGTITVSYLDQS